MTGVIITVALTIFGEAGGESAEGKTAVASVIWTRAGGRVERFGPVCTQPRQFSCWNEGQPAGPKRGNYPEQQAWGECLGIAANMMAGAFTPTVRAKYYHNPKIISEEKFRRLFRAPLVFVAEIGGHRFYREG